MKGKKNNVNNSQTEKCEFGRRNFLKAGAAGTALGALAIGNMALPKSAMAMAEGEKLNGPMARPLEEFPHKVGPNYKPAKQMDNVHDMSFFRNHPELTPKAMQFYRPEYKNESGRTQYDHALSGGAMQGCAEMSGPSMLGVPGIGLHHWEQRSIKEKRFTLDMDYVSDHKYHFKDKKESADMLKRAAQFYGADLVGITHRDERWDFSSFFNPMRDKEGKNPEFGWDEFPFIPKSVIVLAFEMDYEAMSAAPSYLAEAAAGEGYTKMTKSAYQLAIFLKQMGYQAVAAGNDIGLSIPYAIAAGLGEGSRMGCLVTYNYGPRVRLAKVYTDLEFVEYDKPVDFGVKHFCESCMRCADACPAKAISKDKHMTNKPWFNSSWEEQFGGGAYTTTDVEKFYVDAKKCFEFWCKDNNGCGTCITSCPYNKPDFWHHRLVDKLNHLMPGPVHSFMREMDKVFGYGNTFDPKAGKKFWRVKGRKFLGYK